MVNLRCAIHTKHTITSTNINKWDDLRYSTIGLDLKKPLDMSKRLKTSRQVKSIQKPAGSPARLARTVVMGAAVNLMFCRSSANLEPEWLMWLRRMLRAPTGNAATPCFAYLDGSFTWRLKIVHLDLIGIDFH